MFRGFEYLSSSIGWGVIMVQSDAKKWRTRDLRECQKCTLFWSVVSLKMQLVHSPGLDRLCAIHFLPFSTLLWVSTHTLENTALDQLINRCVKLRRQVFLNCSASRGNNRLWLRFRKYITVFTLCVDWVGHTYASLFRDASLEHV